MGFHRALSQAAIIFNFSSESEILITRSMHWS